MKLLYQSDCFGMTDSVTYGIIKGIEQELIRNTGMFVNMPASKNAAQCIKKFPEVCLGQDINLVAGRPVTPPELVPSLVDSDGVFISSVSRIENNVLIKKDGNVMHFENDPYVFDEVLLEVENQYLRFVELNGKKPEYFHGHSLSTPNIRKAMETVAAKYDLKLSHKTLNKNNFQRVPVDWNPKPFFIEKQLEVDVEQRLIEALDKIKDAEKVAFICHCGFVEEVLFDYSTYNIGRAHV